MTDRGPHVACVLGGMDIVRPLSKAGIRSWVMARPGQSMRYSRLVSGVLDYIDPWEASEQFVERLLAFARTQPYQPVLYYENDGYLAAISAYRDELRDAFRFVLPPRDLVDDLVDKCRFQQLARRINLPIPRGWIVSSGAELRRLELSSPVVVKPLTRYDRDNVWVKVGGSAKAICLASVNDIEAIARKVDSAPLSLLAQQLVEGPETQVESYHLYARQPGEVTAAFTGRKIRTWPLQYGHSTALMTSDAPDVAELGGEIVQALGLSGVAKLDFKRDSHGQLHLLEINPRFTLWNHLGAVAGVNIPALVYDDLTGGPVTDQVGPARAGVTWCDLPKDYVAARSASMGLFAWASWAVRSDIKTDLALDDPMPFIRGRLMARAIRTLSRFMPRRTNHA